MALVVNSVPAKVPDLSSYLWVPDRMPRWVSPAEVHNHSGPATEQTRLDIKPGQRSAANSSRSVDELVIYPVREVLVEHHADARATPVEVGHRPPALVDAHRAVGTYQAAAQILAQCGRGQFEESAVTGVLVKPQEHQCRSR